MDTLLPIIALIVLAAPHQAHSQRYSERTKYGRLVGEFKEYAHGIKGTVYVVDESTLFIKGFAYDGTGPDAFFWVGNQTRPSPEGEIVPYPKDYKGREPPILPAISNADIILRLPFPKRIRDIKWLAVWCRRFTVNFGDVFIRPDLDIPKTKVLPEFKRLAHGLRSGNISILDAKTFYIPNLHYDGAGPDAYFWVGNGSEPSEFGFKVPNERGSLEPLRGYQGEDIEIQLPNNLTVYDIQWLAMWCVQYRHNFGHVMIPPNLDVPPALGQTKITTTSTTQDPLQMPKMTNCNVLLKDRLQVQWEMHGNEVQVQLSGRITINQYMAFGISGESGKSEMIGSDVVVAFYDKDQKEFRAVDYHITKYAQCDGAEGVCPDERIGGKNDAMVISGEQRDGVITITYKRPLQTRDGNKDKSIPSDSDVNVIAAIGPLNSRKEANAHNADDRTIGDLRIDFSSKHDHQCATTLSEKIEGPVLKPWDPLKIEGTKEFTARIGPTGGKRGYIPITGHPSWGIAWYINDLLIPEITVERGETYIFKVEGGFDRTNPAKYHPFYITDSSEGGFGQKTTREQLRQRVFAGVGYDSEGNPYPNSAGRYCEWVHKTIDQSANEETFQSFTKTLRLDCENGEPAILNWTVAANTPNIVYYQCYTHNNLGWKIRVTGASAGLSSATPLYTTSAAVLVHLLVLALNR
ncbi:protein Skeletor, isoforms B/C [Neocloeon triangulifer]|uniref:protein Skeletor, isoforms B/C n=1 Tax=Neocloeon triangulifer TaxID=2078957 RepID=UPI00286F721B|nr:protein Skeletor, isoforms B/C [Neocloeon triangulifer]